MNTLAALQDPVRRPAFPRDPLRETFRLDKWMFSNNLRSARRGAAAGPSGMTARPSLHQTTFRWAAQNFVLFVPSPVHFFLSRGAGRGSHKMTSPNAQFVCSIVTTCGHNSTRRPLKRQEKSENAAVEGEKHEILGSLSSAVTACPRREKGFFFFC